MNSKEEQKSMEQTFEATNTNQMSVRVDEEAHKTYGVTFVTNESKI